MSKDKSAKAASKSTPSRGNGRKDETYTPAAPGILTDISRRALMATAGLTAAGLGLKVLTPEAKAQCFAPGGLAPPNAAGKTRLYNATILTMTGPQNDLEVGEILVDKAPEYGGTGEILEIGGSVGPGDGPANNIDCSGCIIMPGFVTTHHHQYESVQRSIIADGFIIFNDPDNKNPEQQTIGWPYEDYRSVVQSIWTSGRVSDPNGNLLFDFGGAGMPFAGEAPQTAAHCEISEKIAAVAQLTQGVTCATDTSQASHTVEHTNGMIEGLKASRARAFYDYSGGTNRSGVGNVLGPDGYEHPGAMGETTWGVGRIRNTPYNMPGGIPDDTGLVTLGLNANQNPVTNRETGATEPYSGWELGRSFGCWINNHAVSPNAVNNDPGKTLLETNPDIGPHLTLVHCVRWQDKKIAQIGAVVGNKHQSCPKGGSDSEAWQRYSDVGGHVSIACPLEMQMRHGMPPIQEALNYGILPSLSPDVDTNQTSDAFTLVRSAFNLQRGLANDQAFAVSDPCKLVAPQNLTTYQALQMGTYAGAVASGLGDKVGRLIPGFQADLIVLQNSVDTAPMHNAPGTVVTMMDTSHVRHTMIAGQFEYWDYQLVHHNVGTLITEITNARDNMLDRMNVSGIGAAIGPGKNTPMPGGVYKPPYLGSCCYVGQNEALPEYEVDVGSGGNLRP